MYALLPLLAAVPCFIILYPCSLKLKEMYQMITLGGDAELELVDTLDPFSEVRVAACTHVMWRRIALCAKLQHGLPISIRRRCGAHARTHTYTHS